MDKSSKNNAVSQLSEAVQQRLGADIRTRVTGAAGPAHAPQIFVEIELPNGKIYLGSGANQREARRKAATKALKAWK